MQRNFRRSDVENRIKEGKNTLRWDKTICHRFAANEARLKMGFLAYNLLHLTRRFYMRSEEARRSIEWTIMRLVKVGQESPITLGIGMSILHRLLRCVTIIGLCLAGSTEVACTEKRFSTIWQERYVQNVRRKGFKQVLERYDGILGFPKAKFCFKQRKVE